jgi:hypothetical protein
MQACNTAVGFELVADDWRFKYLDTFVRVCTLCNNMNPSGRALNAEKHNISWPCFKRNTRTDFPNSSIAAADIDAYFRSLSHFKISPHDLIR